MCWEFEAEYQVCFDHLIIGDRETSLVLLLQDEYNVQVSNLPKFTEALFEFLSEMHQRSFICPGGSGEQPV